MLWLGTEKAPAGRAEKKLAASPFLTREFVHRLPTQMDKEV